MSPRVALFALCATVVAPSSTRADDLPVVRLEVLYAPGIELVCPDEEAIQNAVSARLGYEPFDAAAPRRLTARVSREGTDLVGEVRLTDDTGSLLGERRIDGSGSDCMELARALELAISIAIDPRAMLRPAPPLGPDLLPGEEGPPPPPKEHGRQMPIDTTPPPPGLVTVAPVEVVRVWNVDAPLFEGPPPPDDYSARLIALGETRAKESAPVDDTAATAPAVAEFRSLAGTKSDGPLARFTLWLGGLGVLGTTPTPTLGNTIGVGLSFRYVGLQLEYQRNLPSQGGISSAFEDQVYADLRMLTLSLCGAYDWFFACGGTSAGFQLFGAQGGTLINIGGVMFDQPEQVRPYLGLQGRLGLDVPILWFVEGLRDHVRLRIHGDVNAHALQWHLRRPPQTENGKPGETLWLVPPVGFTAGAALVVGFP